MRSKPLICALALLAIPACADFKRGAYWEQADAAGTGDSGDGEWTYAADVHPILDAGCERCHAPGKSAGNTDFLLVSADVEASYQSTIEFVDVDSPGASRLLAKTAGSGHGGGLIFDDSSAEYELILAWISAGAPP